MSKCKKCGRPLQSKEKDLCLACQSIGNGRKKKVFEIIGIVIIASVGIVVKVLTGAKGGGKA